MKKEAGKRKKLRKMISKAATRVEEEASSGCEELARFIGPEKNFNFRAPNKPARLPLRPLLPLALLLVISGATGQLIAGRSELNFENQDLSAIPSEHLCAPKLVQINEVSLAHNKIRQIGTGKFICLASKLRILNLKANEIERIEELAFEGLEALQVLRLDVNKLSQPPSKATLEPLKALRHLNLAYNRIERLESEAFGPASANLISLDLKGNPLRQVAADSLASLARLQTLILSQSALSGAALGPSGLSELRFYYLDRGANLSSASANLCQDSPKLQSLLLKSNQLQQVPQFAHCQSLLQLDLSYNRLAGALNENFTLQANLIDLYLGHNQLETLHERAFVGLPQLQVLELNDNRLARIHPGAFLPLRATLVELNLAHNEPLSSLAADGLERLASLKAFGNHRLRRLPHFRSATRLALTYAYHCCDYLDRRSSERPASEGEGRSIIGRLLGFVLDKLRHLTLDELEPEREPWAWREQRDKEEDRLRPDNLSEAILWPAPWAPRDLSGQLAKRSPADKQLAKAESQLEAGAKRLEPDVLAERHNYNGANLIDEFAWKQVLQIRLSHSVFEAPVNQPHWLANQAHGRQRARSSEPNAPTHAATLAHPRVQRHELGGNLERTSQPVECLPHPDAFLPCRDLFDTWWLRAGVWCVFLLAFTGNILVIVVLVAVRPSSSASALTSIMWLAHSKRHIDVPRFLVINLAIADLLMALYLGLLAFVDLTTLGEFKLFAIKWQYSTGCRLAGFLGVLSSELSVFILAIITLERNYAITNAVHLNRRLSLQKAMLIMLLGYAFALGMAVMPLYGISDYRKLSICLPLALDSNLSSQIYMGTLVAINSFSFLLLLSCYLRMYCAIRGSQAWNTNDLRIARRMSILVLTDFLCWMPIIVAALSALLGYHLIGNHGLKVLTIFILPLNSVANPFLYAITTKKFKRDLDTLAHRLRAIANFASCAQSSPLEAAAKNNNNHNNYQEQKLFAGYNYHSHQYQHNLMLTGKQQTRHKREASRVQTQRVLSAVADRRRQQYLRQQRAVAANLASAAAGPSKLCTCSCGHQYRDSANNNKPTSNQEEVIKRQGQKVRQANSLGGGQGPRIVLESVIEPVQLAATIATGRKVTIASNSGSSNPEFREPEAWQSGHANLVSGEQTSEQQQQQQFLAPHTYARSIWEPDLSELDLPSRPAMGASCQAILVAESVRALNSPPSGQPAGELLSLIDGSVNVPADRSASACGYLNSSTSQVVERAGQQQQSTEESTLIACANEARILGSSCETVKIGHSGGTMRRSTEKLSRSINRLLFGPIAKAWSSIQISLGSVNNQSTAGGGGDGSSHRLQLPSSPVHGTATEYMDLRVGADLAPAGSRSGCCANADRHCQGRANDDEQGCYLEADNSQADENGGENMLYLTSPLSSLRLVRLNERRMSRSCDVISRKGTQNVYVASPTMSVSGTGPGEPASSTVNSQLDYDDDDQRILLATMNRIASGGTGRSRGREASPAFLRGTGGGMRRCTRCRSWSPALLTKLEECIYQFKSKFSAMGSNTREHRRSTNEASAHERKEFYADSGQVISGPAERAASNSGKSFACEAHADDDDIGVEEIINLRDHHDDHVDGGGGEIRPNLMAADSLGEHHNDDDNEDPFNESGLLEWNLRRSNQGKGYQFSRLRKLQQQSSTTSDTLSTRTGGTVFTNMSVSFDSSTGIPAVSGQPQAGESGHGESCSSLDPTN